MGRYLVWKNGGFARSRTPGRFAGWKPGKIFGRLTCASGMARMKPENRVFFLTWQDAIEAGYRPCKRCRPRHDDRYVRRGGRWHLLTEAG